jgi:aminomethyltransferase
MRRSPLHHRHLELGARFTDFGEWEMPLQYQSVLAEHRGVREGAGLFDVTHLGRFELTGPGAGPALRRLLCNDIDRISPGRCQYTMALNERGGIVDDLIVWWWSEDHYWVMPNAANHQRVMAAFREEAETTVRDLRDSTVFLAVQGPRAPQVLSGIFGVAPSRMRVARVSWQGVEVSMAGTGYTGEPGAEICVDPESGVALLDALLGVGVIPAGLGARDTLRLEAGLPLWGLDLDETTTPFEAGLRFAVSLGHDFVGKTVLVEQEAVGVGRALIGFVLDERGVPRHGHRLRTPSGGEGIVTSGNMSPMLGMGIGLGYLSPPPGEDDTTLEVEIRDRWIPARRVRPPFHR